jgi:hypothetical protein
MKTRIRLRQTSSDPRFADVARIIAKGAPPAWLGIGLEQFSGFVGSKRSTSDEYQRGKKTIELMHDAADRLIKTLGPIFSALPGGAECPEDVRIALDVLPRIKRALLLAMHTMQERQGGGPKPNAQRQFCAAVVVEAWRLVHGKPEPRSILLQKACNEYWLACGGKDRGSDIENWRRDAERFDNVEWIRKVLTALKAEHN